MNNYEQERKSQTEERYEPPFLRMQVWRKACQQEKNHDGNIGINEKPLGEESELACHYRKLRLSRGVRNGSGDAAVFI